MKNSKLPFFSQKGLTLIELLVTSLIGVFVLAAITFFYIDILGFFDRGGSKLELQREATLALEEMAKGIREAEDVVNITNYNGGTNNRIMVQRSGGGNARYYSDPSSNGELYKHEPPGGPEMILGHSERGIEILNLSFEESGSLVVIDLKLKDKEGQEMRFYSTVKLRNKG